MPIPARVVYDHPALPQAGGALAHKERALEAERKERLGAKWTCYACGTRFYDLKKPEPICPRCEADQRESPVFQKKPARSRAELFEQEAALEELRREQSIRERGLDKPANRILRRVVSF